MLTSVSRVMATGIRVCLCFRSGEDLYEYDRFRRMDDAGDTVCARVIERVSQTWDVAPERIGNPPRSSLGIGYSAPNGRSVAHVGDVTWGTSRPGWLGSVGGDRLAAGYVLGGV